MSFNYAKTAATADRLLKRFGAPVTLKRSTPSSDYDPANGAPGAPTVQTWDGVGVKLDYAQTDIDGTLIKQGDQRVYLSVIGMEEPKTGDKVAVNSQDWAVVKSRTLAPGPVAVLYDVQVRRG